LTGRKHSGCSVCRSWCEIGGLGRCSQWVGSEHAWYVSDRAREVADAGELILVALVVGALLASLVGLLAHLVGYDRDRSFYAVVLTVISALYPLFAVMDGARNLVPEVVFFALFAAMGASGFRTSLWVVAVGLLLHGLFDFVRHAHLPAHVAPAWWPAFCGAYDVVAAAGLAFLLLRSVVRPRARGTNIVSDVRSGSDSALRPECPGLVGSGSTAFGCAAAKSGRRLIAGLASALLQRGDVCRGMVVFAVGMSRRIMGLRGTVLPMFVTHALGRSPWCNVRCGMDQPTSRQGRLVTP
jgi:hypothetical protein